MRHGKVTRSLAAAAVVVATALLPASAQADPQAFEQAAFASQSAGVERWTEAFHMTKEDESPARAFGSPTFMLVHPDNPRVIVAATHNLRTRRCYLLRSADAGQTWEFSESAPGPEDYPYCLNNNAGVAEASVAWGRDGTLYYAREGYGEGEGMRQGQASIVLARSTDLGDTWETTVIESNRGKTGETDPSANGVSGLAVDTSGERDVVYVGYTRRYRNAPEGSPLENSHVLVAVSTDGGVTFGEPTALNEHIDVTQTIGGKDYPLLMQDSFGAPFMTVHDGTVLVVAGSTTPADNEPPPPPEAGEGLRPGTWYAHPMPHLVARSTDQGATWSFATLGPPIYAGAGAQTGIGWTPKGGPDGSFVVAYAATPATSPTTGVADIVFQRSTDGGQTWTDPLAIDDDDAADGYTSFYPQLAVAPTGRIDVVWQDNRDQTDYRINVRYTYSMDGGQTWAPNAVVNDEPIDFNLGVSFNSDLRYPPGVASSDHYAVFGWADTRFADELTQTQDNFGAIAQFTPLPPEMSALVPIAMAAFAGLVLAGVVLLLALLMHRRSEPPPPPARVEEPETVGAR